MTKNARTPKLRINTAIEGEVAEWVLSWQRCGLVRSVSDAVRQAVISLNEEFQAMDEQRARLQALSKEGNDYNG